METLEKINDVDLSPARAVNHREVWCNNRYLYIKCRYLQIVCRYLDIQCCGVASGAGETNCAFTCGQAALWLNNGSNRSEIQHRIVTAVNVVLDCQTLDIQCGLVTLSMMSLCSQGRVPVSRLQTRRRNTQQRPATCGTSLLTAVMSRGVDREGCLLWLHAGSN